MSLVSIALLLALPVWVRLALAQDAPCAYWSDWKEVGCADPCGGCGAANFERTCVVEPECGSQKCEGPSSKVEESISCNAASHACRYPRLICCSSHKPKFDPQLRNVTCTPKSNGQAPAPHVGNEDNGGVRQGGEANGPRKNDQKESVPRNKEEKDEFHRGGGHKDPRENGKDKTSVVGNRKGSKSDESSEEKRPRGSGKSPREDVKPSGSHRGGVEATGNEEQKGGKGGRRSRFD